METPRSEEGVELDAKPTEARVRLGIPAADALAIARDPDRTLVLRVEGITVKGQPGGVYDVSIAGQSVGVLTFYGVQQIEGEAVHVFAIDEAVAGAAHALEGGDALTVVFTPKGRIEEGREIPVTESGRASFKRLRVVEEKLPQ